MLSYCLRKDRQQLDFFSMQPPLLETAQVLRQTRNANDFFVQCFNKDDASISLVLPDCRLQWITIRLRTASSFFYMELRATIG